MFGKNPITKPTKEKIGYLNVTSIFTTIQGEGPLAGTPALFIRLQGCNLKCDFCDTEFSTGRPFDLSELLSTVIEEINLFCKPPYHSGTSPLVVITGGEPLLQADVVDLIKGLVAGGIRVQIETAGTVFPKGLKELLDSQYYQPYITIICSPKTPSLNKKLAPYIYAYKYVMRKGEIDEVDGLPIKVARPTFSVVRKRTEIFVMPCDEHDADKNKENVQLAIASATHFGYRLCLQIHKIINVE